MLSTPVISVALILCVDLGFQNYPPVLITISLHISLSLLSLSIRSLPTITVSHSSTIPIQPQCDSASAFSSSAIGCYTVLVLGSRVDSGSASDFNAVLIFTAAVKSSSSQRCRHRVCYSLWTPSTLDSNVAITSRIPVASRYCGFQHNRYRQLNISL